MYAVIESFSGGPFILPCLLSRPASVLTAFWTLHKSLIQSIIHAGGLVVVDTGATDHMLLDALAFISYKRVMDFSICMGNNSFVPVLGYSTALFSLNRKHVLVWNILHIPGLAVPLYSLGDHLHQRGCKFIGTFKDGFHVYFPTFFSPLTCLPTVILSTNLLAHRLLSGCFTMYSQDGPPTFILQRLWYQLHTLWLLRIRMMSCLLASCMAMILLFFLPLVQQCLLPLYL